MGNKEIAVKKFREGYNCAQSVLFSLSKYTDLPAADAIKIATGFGVGMGRTQYVCGAISGGILAINLLYGRGEGEDREQQEIAYEKVRQLITEFEEKNTTILCRDLMAGVDLLTEEGQKKFKSENLGRICEECIASAVEITEKIIQNN